jgi:hypothetical protein
MLWPTPCFGLLFVLTWDLNTLSPSRPILKGCREGETVQPPYGFVFFLSLGKKLISCWPGGPVLYHTVRQ